jgi:hypothetical protein
MSINTVKPPFPHKLQGVVQETLLGMENCFHVMEKGHRLSSSPKNIMSLAKKINEMLHILRSSDFTAYKLDKLCNVLEQNQEVFFAAVSEREDPWIPLKRLQYTCKMFMEMVPEAVPLTRKFLEQEEKRKNELQLPKEVGPLDKSIGSVDTSNEEALASFIEQIPFYFDMSYQGFGGNIIRAFPPGYWLICKMNQKDKISEGLCLLESIKSQEEKCVIHSLMLKNGKILIDDQPFDTLNEFFKQKKSVRFIKKYKAQINWKSFPFYKEISRGKATTLLNTQPKGAFLLRTSGIFNCPIFSLRMTNEVTHHLIVVQSSGVYLWGHLYRSIDALVMHLKESKAWKPISSGN